MVNSTKKTTTYATLAFAAAFATPAFIHMASHAVEAASPVNLKDIEKHWAKDTINEAVKLGYVSGYEDGTFKPDNTISNAEFIKMLVVALNQTTNYTHKAGADWYQLYVDEATKEGLTFKNEFPKINASMKRSDLAKLGVRAVGETTTDERKWMYLATLKGLIKGVDSKGTLNENGNMTRAEAVTVVERILKIKSGETLPSDKYAVANAEILWHRTNVFTVIPQWFFPQAIDSFKGTESDLKFVAQDGNIVSKIHKYVAIDLDDKNDPNRHLLKDKFVRFAEPGKRVDVKALDATGGFVLLSIGELLIKDTSKINTKAIPTLTLSKISMDIWSLPPSQFFGVYPNNQNNGGSYQYLFLQGQFGKSVNYNYFNGMYISKKFNVDPKSDFISLYFDGITQFSTNLPQRIYTYAY